MKTHHYYAAVVYTAEIQWDKVNVNDTIEEGSMYEAKYIDRTQEYRHDLNWLDFPYYPLSSDQIWKKHSETSKVNSDQDQFLPPAEEGKDAPLFPPAPPTKQHSTSDSNYCPIMAFFHSYSIRTCARCQRQYFPCDHLNTAQSCRYHEGYYVCRRHPAEIRCSISGLGDNLGYYGNGQEGWEAKFWDCCGSEDPKAEGCKTSCHFPYS